MRKVTLAFVFLALAACSQPVSTPGDISTGQAAGPGPWIRQGRQNQWRVLIPSAWGVQELVNACSGSLRGVIGTDASFQFTPRFDRPCSWRRFGRWIMDGFPKDGVALAVGPASWFPLGGRDYHPVELPTSLDYLHLTSGLTGGPVVFVAPLPHFFGDADGYELRAWIGRNAPPDEVALLEQALQSVRVQTPGPSVPACAPPDVAFGSDC